MDLPEGKMAIGRSRHCDLSIQEPTISRKHVFVTVEAGRLWLDDLGSSNGTFVNGQRVTSQVELRDGDKVRLGDAELEVEISSTGSHVMAPSSVETLAPPLGEPPEWDDDESAEDGQPTAPVPYVHEIDADGLGLEELEASMEETVVTSRPVTAKGADAAGAWSKLGGFLRSLFRSS